MNRLPQNNREPTGSSNPHPDALSRGRASNAKLAKSHYENFLVASVLLPRRLRQPFYDVYAFCRVADDFADESTSPAVAKKRLIELRQQVDATFAGHPPTDSLAALADTVRRFDLCQQPFYDLLDAFDQDQVKNRYDDFTQLQDYCRRSANPVGRIVLGLGECSDEKSASLSDEICTGLQLANFWQDVARDFAIGRIYLPHDTMSQFGVTETDLAEGVSSRSTPQGIRDAIQHQCELAESFFHRGLPLADLVPRWLAADIRLFAHGGLAALDAIRRIDFDVLRIRPKVTKSKQLRMVARAALGWL